MGATGTGLIQSFLRLQANGSEQGFNTDYRPVPLDDKAGNFTHSITLGDIPTVEIDGVTYREFRLDLNEKDSKSNDNISLTSLKLFSADAGNLSTLSSAQLLYNLDSAGDVTLPLTEWSTGSGHGDYVVVVPDAAFVDAQGHTLADSSFIYLYSAFSGSDGGFEEWYIRPAETLDNTVSVTTTQGATGSATSQVTINSTADTDLQISKIAEISGGNGNKIVDAANDHITWTITVHNTSNVDLHNVTVNDPFATATYVSGDNGDHILQANETWTYTATHIVTQGEIDAGVQLVNTATVDADEILPQSATSVVGVVNPFHAAGPGAVFQDPFTASYWAGHLAAWDGSSGNNAAVQTEVKNGHLSSADLFSFTGGVVNSNHNGVIDANDQSGVLIGDANGDGLANPGEDVLFIGTSAAQDLIKASGASTDMRLLVAKEALAAQLNIDNLAGFDGHTGSKQYQPNDLITEAVKYLKGEAPYQFGDGSSGNVDTNHDSVIGWNSALHTFTEGSAVSSGQNAWTSKVDVFDGASTVLANGSNLRDALSFFNQDQLVVSNDGNSVAWNNGSNPAGGIYAVGVHTNDPDNFWMTLKDSGHLA